VKRKFLKNINKLIFILVALLLSACSGVNFAQWHFPYMMPVGQGNYITVDQYAEVKKGMTKEQVSFILGSPLSEFMFSQNRWDYAYQAYKNNKLTTTYVVTVLFDKENRVTQIYKEGNLFSQ
jgi:outer membrane protein assembly factor BamE